MPIRSAVLRNKNNVFQLIWGSALVLVGVGVIFRTPRVMTRVATIDQFTPILAVIRFCFYFMGAFLIGGGVKKIYENGWKADGPDQPEQ